MGRLSAVECFNAKPDRKGRDRMLGDGDGLFLRIRAHGTRTWVIEYLFEGARRKFTIGILDKLGAGGEYIELARQRPPVARPGARDRVKVASDNDSSSALCGDPHKAEEQSLPDHDRTELADSGRIAPRRQSHRSPDAIQRPAESEGHRVHRCRFEPSDLSDGYDRGVGEGQRSRRSGAYPLRVVRTTELGSKICRDPTQSWRLL
ncbi:MAG: Arm DNA-binding domain-containing protein [Burkholderiales bacterium]